MDEKIKNGICRLKSSTFYTRYGPKPTQRIGGTHFDPSIKRLYAYSEDRPDVIVVKMVEYSDSIAMTRQEFEDQFVIGE
jgi:hypothetical protein